MRLGGLVKRDEHFYKLNDYIRFSKKDNSRLNIYVTIILIETCKGECSGNFLVVFSDIS